MNKQQFFNYAGFGALLLGLVFGQLGMYTDAVFTLTFATVMFVASIIVGIANLRR